MPDSVTTTRTTTTKKSTAKPATRAFWDPEYYADPRNATMARSITDPWMGGDVMTAVAYHRAQIAAMASMYTPETERSLLRVLDGSPNVSPGVAASLAAVADRFQLPQEVFDEILTVDAEVKAQNPQLVANRKPESGSEAEKGGLASVLGEVTRPLFALASMPYELVIGSFRSLAGDIVEHDEPGYQRETVGEELGEIASQSLGMQYLRGLFDPEISADMGEGYVPRGDVAARQIEAARTTAPLVYGHAWTLGRGFASTIYDDPENLGYRNLSGFIDLVANIVLDPLVLVSKPAGAARTVRAGISEAARREEGARVLTAEVEELAEQAASYAERTKIVSRETLEAANAYTREVGRTYADAHRNYTGVGNAERAELDARMDRLLDREDLARADAADPRDVNPAEAGIAVDHVVGNLGPEATDAMAADIIAKSPELPGVFTDAVPLAGEVRILPAADDGVDALARYDGPDDPILVSVDDPIEDVDELVGALTAGVGRSKDRTKGISQLTALARAEGTRYGDLMVAAEKSRTGSVLYNALRESHIDGVTDVFRLTGTENGVWWTGRDMTVLRSEEAGYSVVDTGAEAVGERLRRLGEDKAALAEQIAAVERKRRTAQVAAASMADQYARVVDTRTAVADSYEAVRNAVEMAYGVRRRIDGKAEVSYDLVREALVGTTRSFDDAVAAHAKVPADLRAAAAVDRAFTGAMTLGASEVARAIKTKAIDPFIARTREAVLTAMVRLDDTPANLGLLHRLTSGKINPTLLRGVLQARTEDEVLSVLGPALGVDITRPIDVSALTAARLRLHGLESGRGNDVLFTRAQRWMLDRLERGTAIAPRVTQHINLADPMGAAQTLRNYLTTLPAKATDYAAHDRIIGEFLSQGTEVGRAKVVRKALNLVADELAEWTQRKHGIADDTKELLADRLRRATRIYDTARADVNNWWLGKYQNDSSIGYMTVDGQLIHLTGPQLEAELARGGMVLPDMREIRDRAGRWGAAIEKTPGLKAARDVLDKGLDIWRSAVLFRYAYTIRNIGEMQFRMFLSGHHSLLGHPLSAMAMASALNKKTPFQRRWLASLAKYNQTASGKTLGAVGSEELDATDEVLSGFIDLMQRTSSAHDMRSFRAMAVDHNVKEVRVGQPEFVQGWADQLLTLTQDRLARVVAGADPSEVRDAMARGVDRKVAVVDWLMHSSGARGMRREYAEAGEDYARIFTDPRALRDFLFDSPASIQARVWEYTMGGNTDLLDFVATGTLRAEGKPVFSYHLGGIDPELRVELMAKRTSNLARNLRGYLDQAPEDMKLRMRVYSPGQGQTKGLDKMFDTFFAWNGRKENAWAMGPEFSYAFNDSIVRLMPALDMATRQQVLDFVKDAEGRWAPHSETLMAARAAMKQPEGGLNMADAERIAAGEASEHVKNLFYDARNRNMFYHQMRMVWPFAQPFFNTLNSWGRLMAARPYTVEKIGRLAQGLTEPGSGVIYDDFDAIDPLSDRQSRDPTQGFIFTHPETDEQMFAYPLIGSILGAMVSPIAGFNAAESMQLQAPVASLNLAFQGDIDYLPGLGPILTIPTALIMPDDWYGTAPEWFRRWAFPFGEPNLEGGLIESTTLPAWARRLTGALGNEEFRSYSYRGLIPYFVSTREYPNLAGDPRQQQKLIDDVKGAAGWLTFIRALGASFLPAAPSQNIYAADKDGRMIGSVYLAHHFQQLREDAGGDYEAATRSFIDLYGEQAIAAIVPSTEGEMSISGPGWEWFKAHGAKAKPFADVIGAFFPGDFSTEANRFMLESGVRERLSVDERTAKMVEYLYSARKAALEGRAASEEWDEAMVDEAKAELERSFGGVLPAFSGEDSQHKLDEIKRALKTFPDLAETRGGQGAVLLFDAFERYSDESEKVYGVGLRGIKAEPLRQQFLDEVDEIAAEYGGRNRAEGSVDTIAMYFVKIVQPRG